MSTKNSSIARENLPGLTATIVSRETFIESWLTFTPLPGEPPVGLFQRAAEKLRMLSAEPVQLFAFGDAKEHEACLQTLGSAPGGTECPISWVRERRCAPGEIAGLQIHAVSGIPVQTVQSDGRAVGRFFEDNYAEYYLLGGIGPDDPSAPQATQAQQMFKNLESALSVRNMTMQDTARTWLFMKDILDWYDDFNTVRNRFFTERKIFESRVPASTGIWGDPYPSAALVTSALAMKPKDDSVRIDALPSPLQCAALEYGSAFSRAVEIALPDLRRVLVSGTASIEPEGASVHIGDPVRQIDLTMRIVLAILESREMSFADVTRGIAYFQSIEDLPIFEKYCLENAILDLPVIVAECDVCRGDLLFEIEIDATLES